MNEQRIRDTIETTGYMGFLRRLTASLLLSMVAGFFAMLVDLDHIVCFIQGIEPWSPETGQYGCRLWHHYLVPVGSVLGCIGIALLAGLYGVLVLHSVRARAKSKQIKKV